jgi:hypothetical protein
MKALLTALALCLVVATPALADRPTARSSGIQKIYAKPRLSSPVLDRLKDDERVYLDRCTRETRWCLVRQLDGGPRGWVMGADLVGSPAKVLATPYEFSFDVFDPLGNGRWPGFP